ncbi:Spy/CpxP family protein refolding chaperone [Bradyrhizobium jicamae]|uniref:Spy/CpxP family protein refolding chaperone n=1 Tax=Bradyrhizobium jicamae TaxID=280332 RepID=UPI002011AD8F|nr:Spy/CpxP family protein refolding chaperone [Bradyrhizobium jicamae]
MTDYAVWGDGIGFWDYGYRDLYAAIFAPYGRDELVAFTEPRPFGRRHRKVAALSELCGRDGNDIAGLPATQLQPIMQLSNEAQRTSMDDLAKALAASAQLILASCPAQPALTAPARLAVMQERIEAMIKARYVLQQPLEKFYDLLDDEQEARLSVSAGDRRKMSAANASPEAPAQGCGMAQLAALPWPAAEIEARLHPNDAQRPALNALQNAAVQAAGILGAHCQPEDATTPPARLDAVQGRLEAMLQAIGLVSAALKDFYATLTDEQKAQFEAIGQKRTA